MEGEVTRLLTGDYCEHVTVTMAKYNKRTAPRASENSVLPLRYPMPPSV